MNQSLRPGQLLALGLCINALVAASLRGADGTFARQTPGDADMVLVPAGPFTMGSFDGAPEESPPQQLDLPAFYIDRKEEIGRAHV